MNLSDDLPPRWIIIKGGLFALILLIASVLVVIDQRMWIRAFLVLIVIWSSARLYYFCFYVIEKYVDGDYKFAGVWSAIRFLWRKRRKKS
ncbi:MAG: hypothetical protein AAFX93_15375 [Verrucomicrobiota bacterium]